MNKIEPTYLRYIYDGLNKGSINSQNASSLPNGFIGLFEEAFSSDKSVSERSSLLNRLGLWALFKGPVSCDFVCKILKQDEEKTKALVDEYSKWFNSPSPGKYILYHDRLRTYLLQKLSNHESQALNEKIISHLEQAIKNGLQDEAEEYALEHLSTHMYVESQLDKNYDRLHEYVNNEVLWPRQIQVSKEYKWSQDGVQKSIKEATRRHDKMNTLKATVNSVKLHQDEQSSIESIIHFFENKEFYVAIERIKRLNVEQRIKISFFFLQQLLFGSFNTIPDLKDVCSLIIDSLYDIKTKLYWKRYFPIIFMYKIHKALKKLALKDDIFWIKNTLSDMDLLELLDSEHKEMKAKAFNDKINYIKKNGFSKSEFSSGSNENELLTDIYYQGKTQTHSVYYILAYLASVKGFSEDNIDLLDLISIWELSEGKQVHQLIKILNFHFEKSSSGKIKKNRNQYYCLPGDKIISIISRLFKYSKDGYKKEEGSKEIEMRIKFHKILNKNCLIRNNKFQLDYRFEEDITNRLLLFNLCMKNDNIFKKITVLNNVCEEVDFTEIEKKNIVTEYKNELNSSNIHPAHLATAYSSLAAIFSKLNKLSDCFEYLNFSFSDKEDLYKINLNNNKLKENVGDIEAVIYDFCLIYTNSNLNKDQRLDVFKKIEKLLNIHIKIQFNMSDLLSFKSKEPEEEYDGSLKKDKNGEIVYKESWGFNRVLNIVLINFSHLFNSSSNKRPCSKDVDQSELLLNSFKKISYNLGLDFLFKINQNSINYLKNYSNVRLDNSDDFLGLQHLINTGSTPDENYFNYQISKSSETNTAFKDSKISLRDNVISGLMLYYQKLIVSMLEGGFFKRALFYFKEYSNSYTNPDLNVFVSNIKEIDESKISTENMPFFPWLDENHQNLYRHQEKILDNFKNSYFYFIKSLLKHPIYYDKAINERAKKFFVTIIEKIPNSIFYKFIFDTSLVIRTIDHFGVNEFIKKVFTSVNVFSTGSISLQSLYGILQSIIEVEIQLNQTSKSYTSLDIIFQESINIINERLFVLAKDGGYDKRERAYYTIRGSEKLIEFKVLLEKLKEIDSDKIIKYLNDDMINLLYSVSYSAKHKKDNKFKSWLESDYIEEELSYKKIVVGIMSICDEKLKAKQLNKLIQEKVSNSYLEVVRFLSRGYLPYNSIEKKHENSEMFLFESEDDFLSVIFQNPDFLTEYQINYLKEISPLNLSFKFNDSDQKNNIVNSYYDYERLLKKFHLGYLLISMEKYEEGINLLETLPKNEKKIKSLAYYYSTSKLLSKNKYRLALRMNKKITCPYFNCLSLFKLYKYYEKTNQIKSKKTYSLLIEKVNKLKLPFQKSDVFYEIHKFKKQLGDMSSLSFLKNKIDELCYILCIQILDCEELLNSGNKIQAKSLFNKINLQLKKTSKTRIEYGSRLSEKYEALKIKLFGNNAKEKLLPNSYSDFFSETNFDLMDYEGCGHERDEVNRLGKLREKEKLEQMADSIKFQRLRAGWSGDTGAYNAKIIQAEIYTYLEQYEKAYTCLASEL